MYTAFPALYDKRMVQTVCTTLIDFLPCFVGPAYLPL